MLEKNNTFATTITIITVLGLLAVFGLSLIFHTYTDEAWLVGGEPRLNAEGQPVGPNWRDNEPTMRLETMRVVVVVSGVIALLGVIFVIATNSKNMKKQNIVGIVLVVLSLFTVLGFQTLFYPCMEMMAASPRPMRCVWTMRTLFAVAAVIGAAGAMMMFSRVLAFAKGVNFSAVFAGLAFLAIPTMATGACVVHRCVDGFRPFSIVMGGVMTVVAIAGAFMLKNNEEDMGDEA